jgi:mono/diheme cytochrome c family protein
MLKYALIVPTITLLSAIACSGQATPESSLAPTDGRQMFSHYCTPCHGTDGKGHGRVVTEHKAPPVDLTILSKNNRGAFPADHVVHVLQHGAQIPPHTSVEMPVWGPILGKINLKDPKDRMIRVRSLTQYLESIQEK